MPKQKKCDPLNIFWSVLTNDGAEEIGVVIRTERGYEAYHHRHGYLAEYSSGETANSAILFHNTWRDAV